MGRSGVGALLSLLFAACGTSSAPTGAESPGLEAGAPNTTRDPAAGEEADNLMPGSVTGLTRSDAPWTDAVEHVGPRGGEVRLVVDGKTVVVPVVTEVPRGATTLELSLATDEDSKVVAHASARGPAWVRRFGCDEPSDGSWPWTGPGDGEAGLWVDRAVDATRDRPSELVVAVRGARAVTVADVLALVDLVLRRRGIEAVDLGVGGCGRRRVDDAVETGLRWLAAHQADDGTWSGAHWGRWCEGQPAERPFPGDGDAAADVATTAMATLAFLGAGYTNRGDHPFAKIVWKAQRRLKAAQSPDGRFGPDARSHAWATLALIESFGMTQSPTFRGAATLGLEALRVAWAEAADDPVTLATASLAFKSAALVANDMEKHGKVPPWTVDPRARAAVLVALERLDTGRDALAAAASLEAHFVLSDDPRALAARASALSLPQPPDRGHPAYTWLGTLARFGLGGETWQPWSLGLQAAVVANGAVGPPCCLGGSFAPPRDVFLPGGRVEATALLTMSLEVYYRYEKVVGTACLGSR